jgi:hypothetical protein
MADAASAWAALDAAWLSARLGRAVARLSLDAADTGKLNALSCLRFARAELSDGTQLALAIKLAAASPTSRRLGLAREALLLRHWRELSTAEGSSCELGSVLPPVLHAEGSLETGAKVIVLEDLSASCVQLGRLFGKGNPNNWGVDLEASTRRVPPALDAAAAMRLAFSAAAKLHAPYWGCRALVGQPSLSWLRGAGWLGGRESEAWVATQADVAARWGAVKAKIAGAQEQGYQVRWDPLVVAILDASVAKAARGGWAAFQTELAARDFTLCHGDFHPANVLLDCASQKVLLVDWEVVGLGSGVQELGQFAISHLDPLTRAAVERDAVTAYYAELKTLNPRVTTTMSEQQCWHEYKVGGLGRWCFFLPFDGWEQPPAVSQFFVDQVAAFVQHHGIMPETAPMPRL